MYPEYGLGEWAKELHCVDDRQLTLNVEAFLCDSIVYARGFASMMRFLYEKELLIEYEKWRDSPAPQENKERPNGEA